MTTQKSENILRELQERIERRELGPGQHLPSERHLAAEFRVSRANVQDAISRLEQMGLILRLPNCRPRVRREDESIGLAPRNGRDHIALWIHPNLEDLGAATILKGIRNALGAAGYKAVIGCPESPQQTSEGVFLQSLVYSPSVAGAIIWHNGGSDILSAYLELSNTRTPLVFVDREPPEPIRADLVCSDNRGAARRAVEHLLELGHRRIALVSNIEAVSSVRDRAEGYRDALEGAGIAIEPQLQFTLSDTVGAGACSEAQALVSQMLSLSEPPSAIFAVNDHVAMHVHEACKTLSVAIPQDLSLVGFDWFLRWLPAGGYLTTVCQHFEEIGRVAVDLLLQRLASPTPFIARRIYLEAPLVHKGSTASPSTRHLSQ